MVHVHGLRRDLPGLYRSVLWIRENLRAEGAWLCNALPLREPNLPQVRMWLFSRALTGTRVSLPSRRPAVIAIPQKWDAP